MATIRFAGHNLSLPFLLLGAAEYVVMVGAFLLGGYYSTAVGHLPPGGLWNGEARFLLHGVIYVLSIGAMGLYQPHRRDQPAQVWARLLMACALGSIVLSLAIYFWPALYVASWVLLGTLVVGYAGLVVVRGVFLRTVDQNILRRRVLVYGAGTRATHLLRLRRAADRRGFKLAGFLPAPSETAAIDAGHILHIDTSLTEFAARARIHEIVIACPHDAKLPESEFLLCRLNGVRVIDMAAFLERETRRIVLDDPDSAMHLIYSLGFRSAPIYEYVKRGFDIVLAALMLVVTTPLWLAVGLAIVFEDGFRHSIFYRQQRVGLAGAEITVLKFRSMCSEAEADRIARQTEHDDPRITRVGHVIRRFRLDELPQLLNVLRGDMSLVGPRPERGEFVARYLQQIPHYALRLQVRPGLTGWAQLRYPYGDGHQGACGKLEYDLYYVKHRDLLFDLIILLQTMEVVVFGHGVR